MAPRKTAKVTASREKLEWLLGTKVFLRLCLKAQPNWRENPVGHEGKLEEGRAVRGEVLFCAAHW
jgi:hypothetical protein